MSNDYLQFSEELTGLTEVEADWLVLVSNLASDRDVDLKENDDQKHFSDEGEALTDEAKLAEELFPDEDVISAEASLDEEAKTWSVWFYSEEGNDPNAVAKLVQAFFKKFRVGKGEVFSLTWADYNDKLKIGAFGGGALVVTEKSIMLNNVHEVVEEMLERVKES